MRSFAMLSLASASLLAFTTITVQAHAQEAQPSASGTQAQTYLPADFARFAPRTALDMLDRVPGFSIRQATVERGLGQATGNVLLNGERISNKSDDIATQLRRIPADNVVRIEIRDGATLGIPGLSGQIANVVAQAGGLSGQFTYRAEGRQYFTDPVLNRFEASVSGETGPIEFTLGLDNLASHSGAGGDTVILDAAGRLIERRDEIWTNTYNQPRISGRFVYDGPGDAIGNLSLFYRDFKEEYVENGSRVGPGAPDRRRTFLSDYDGYDYEIGGDFRFRLGPGQLKLIGLERFTTFIDVNDATVRYVDGRPNTGDRFTSQSEERERIGRAEYQWTALGGEWEVSAEAAFNSLDGVNRLFVLEPTGAYRETALPGGTATVEEDRYEAVVSYGRALTETLSVQIAAGAEHSELSQVGGGGLTRTFERPKGQFTAVWEVDESTRVNLRLQHRVSQLNFSDFLASVSLNDDRQNAGNPELTPPRNWEFEAEVARQNGAWGNATLRLYAHLVQDIVDYVPIGDAGEAVGNLDEAQRYGAELRATTNLDPAGLTGVRADARVWLQTSRVEDPLTGQTRDISGVLQQFVSLSIRHDVPGSNWAYGGSLNHQRNAPVYRLSQVFRQWEMPLGSSAFLEHKNVFGLTVRASAANLFYGESYLDRTAHAGRRTDPVSFVEIRDRTIGPIFQLEVRGRF